MGMGLRPEQQHHADGIQGWDPVAGLRSRIREAHQLIAEQVSLTLQRTRLMLGADSRVLSIYVHNLCIEDATVHVLLREMRPLFQRIWIAGNLLPLESDDYSRLRDKRVRRDGCSAGGPDGG